jgi:BrxA
VRKVCAFHQNISRILEFFAGAVRYQADITAGALKLQESRIIADLLLRGVDEGGWKDAIVKQNVLQARNPATATRLSRLIRGRLELMDADLWRLVRDGIGTVASHAVLTAAIKHSPLLGDFLDLVVREQYRLFTPALSKKLWDDYLDDCRGRDPEMPLWNDSTRKRLRSSVFQILAQAGFLENTRTLKLQPVHIAPQVLRYLKNRDEEYVLRCMQVSP